MQEQNKINILIPQYRNVVLITKEQYVCVLYFISYCFKIGICLKMKTRIMKN